MDNNKIFSQGFFYFQKKFGFSTDLVLVGNFYFLAKLLKCLQKNFLGEKEFIFFYSADTFIVSH